MQETIKTPTEKTCTGHAPGVPVERLVRRFPVNFKAIAKESGLRKGKLCFSPIWGWCVQNTHNIDGPSVGSITAPEISKRQVLKVVDNHWCIYTFKYKCRNCGFGKYRKGPVTGWGTIYYCPKCTVEFSDPKTWSA